MTPSDKKITVTLKRNYDEIFVYEILHPIGHDGIKEKGDTKDLLKGIPYLLSFGIIPPEKIINEILTSGLQDAGMSGGVEWEPYRLNEGEFEKLVSALVEDSNGTLQYIAPPEWVENYHDWQGWIMGVPWKEYKRLNNEYLKIEQEKAEAESRGDKELAEKLHLKSVEAGNKLAKFLMKHLKKGK